MLVPDTLLGKEGGDIHIEVKSWEKWNYIIWYSLWGRWEL